MINVRMSLFLKIQMEALIGFQYILMAYLCITFTSSFFPLYFCLLFLSFDILNVWII